MTQRWIPKVGETVTITGDAAQGVETTMEEDAMAKEVWKFPFALKDGPQSVQMPNGAKVVSVAMQRNSVTAWAIVEPSHLLTKRTFTVHGTGHPLESSEEYVGTAMDGHYVWHLFEVPA